MKYFRQLVLLSRHPCVLAEGLCNVKIDLWVNEISQEWKNAMELTIQVRKRKEVRKLVKKSLSPEIISQIWPTSLTSQQHGMKLHF